MSQENVELNYRSHDAFNRRDLDAYLALNDPDVRRKLLESGAVPAPSSPEELGKLMQSELTRWSRVVKEHAIKEE